MEGKVFLRVDDRGVPIDHKALESIYGPGVKVEHIYLSEIRGRIKRGDVLGIIIEAGDEESALLPLLSDSSFLALLASSGVSILVPRITFRSIRGGGRFPVFERFDYIRVEMGKDLMIPLR